MYNELINKAERILKSNIYEENNYLWGNYRMISPSKEYFPGVWNWDSAFHAIGMTYIDCELAKEQIEGFFQFQKEDGMLPDVIWERGDIVDTFSKPPVMAYAAERVYKECHDLSFLRRIFPKLIKLTRFWENERQIDGMFHYDADRNCDEKTYLTNVGYESGWDNSPRWDSYPQNYWAIDLNCFMVMTYKSLTYIAKELGEEKTEWKGKAEKLAELIDKRLWNNNIKAYTDYNYVNKAFSSVLTPASFMPLFIGIAPDERAEFMHKIALEHFMPGMPTVSYKDPAYSTDYWRGPCWMNTAYFAAMGLKKYGFSKTADEIKETILNWVYNDGEFIHENYNSKTGEGLCADRFSWSCVFVLEFINNWK